MSAWLYIDKGDESMDDEWVAVGPFATASEALSYGKDRGGSVMALYAPGEEE